MPLGAPIPYFDSLKNPDKRAISFDIKNNFALRPTFALLRCRSMASRPLRKTRSIFSLAVVKHTLRWSGRLVLLLVVIDIAYLVVIWPDWEKYTKGSVQRSSFIRNYELEQRRYTDWPKLRWNPVSIGKIPKHMIRAAIAAEDSRFYQHEGVDFDALKEAMEYNLSEQRMAYGASTISQQTVKNIFLSPSRNPLRKWHEFLLTLGMERNLTKKRILEHYLNLAEFGKGIYGVEAAARYYWGIPAYRLTSRQAIELAATLPSPVKNNPRTRTKSFQKRVKRIRRYFRL
jgi:monofunctional biosynthetic peptidoglycan transglycosylase